MTTVVSYSCVFKLVSPIPFVILMIKQIVPRGVGRSACFLIHIVQKPNSINCLITNIPNRHFLNL